MSFDFCPHQDKKNIVFIIYFGFPLSTFFFIIIFFLWRLGTTLSFLQKIIIFFRNKQVLKKKNQI